MAERDHYNPESHGAGPANGMDTSSGLSVRRDQERYRWTKVHYLTCSRTHDRNAHSCIPPPRSGAASVVLDDKLYVFGGFGGETERLDDFYAFDFATSTWEEINVTGDSKPGCRENNGVVISGPSRTIILFGGYNGSRWLNDLWSFDTTTRRWTCLQESLDTTDIEDETRSAIDITAPVGGYSVNDGVVQNSNPQRKIVTGTRPCCRFGYVSFTHKNKFILWGGFDGTNWLNDMYIFDFESLTWSRIKQFGAVPSRRSCPAWAKDENHVYLHGGYDGNERKDDFFCFSLDTYTWIQMPNRGRKPSPRYLHSCVLYENKIIIFGGYSGSQRLPDMHVYDCQSNYWSEIDISNGDAPSGRSSLVAQVFKNHLYIFAGYNGNSVMNDMYKCRLQPIFIPSSSLVNDFRRLMNETETSDVTFLVDGKEIRAHRIVLAVRSQYFKALLFNGYLSESSTNDKPIEVSDLSYEAFSKVVEFLYTDCVSDVTPELGIDILVASELFMLERLKAKCEDIIRGEINIDNATDILLASHQHNSPGLKEIALDFILQNLNEKGVQNGLNDLKAQPELLVEIINMTSSQLLASSTHQEFHPTNQQFSSLGSQQGPQDFFEWQNQRLNQTFGNRFGTDGGQGF